MKVVDEATGVFMTGGNQLKLSAVICGTPVGDAVVRAHERGAVVGGTSAGASIQSSHMVAFGGPGVTPKQRMTQVAAGLGLLGTTVIDQHFDQRNRYGRLLMIVSQSPQLLGIGVDEDTCATVTVEDGHEILRVSGRGAVTVLDPANLVTNAYEAKRSSPLLASGIVLHVLPGGTAYDLTDRALLPSRPSPPTTPPSSRRRRTTCGGWRATSPPATPGRRSSGDVWPALAASRKTGDPRPHEEQDGDTR